MPSSCLQPATFLTAAVRTTRTSWRISSCKIHSGLVGDFLISISILCSEPFESIVLLLYSLCYCIVDQRIGLEKMFLGNMQIFKIVIKIRS